MTTRRRRRYAAPLLPDGWVAGLRRAAATVVSVCHPDWRGVRTAAHAFRAPVVEVADAGAAAPQLVAGLQEAGVEVLVVQGFPPGSAELLGAAARSGIATRAVVHSSTAQHGADAGEAEAVDRVLDLAAEGRVGRVGFVKEGLAEAFRALGHPAVYVPNRVPDLPVYEPVALGGGFLDVGVFAEPYWRKNVATQLAAVALLDGGRAHVMRRPDVGYLRAVELVEHGELPWPQFVALQGSVDLNLYVTLSECHPITPLESYASGVPCLVSRTSAVFRSDPELWTLATVAEADNPRAIAAAARRLLANAAEAQERAAVWMAAADGDARRRWEAFVA